MASAKGGKRDPIQAEDLVDGRKLFGGSRPRRSLKQTTGLRIARDGINAIALACGFFIAEILDLARHECEAEGKKKITPRHINLGMSRDEEMSVISSSWLIKGGGVKHPATAEMLRGKAKPSQDL
ncbi:hypothetical protein VCUG_02355 [Vavraia culicis subsp. floridensis]|uniref:Transcription factor CBF/NF-Y/archaeal histone domain-containing protein n=1 Tax=Vavraia culicis (isolate floridensis) TaxID=948595 RepID=L2GS70_VAVCU|nr:uncharacterized protein VCUG_02355 [Vavraia culicis subsp. floridensis]ELA46153.1 hypothetical protein VCUG_02355 [Vavraia culicis subsp. floridensis]